VLAFGMAWVSSRSKFVPNVVGINKLGYTFAATSALTDSTAQTSTDQMMPYELAAFVRNARQVITDPAAKHRVIEQLYSRAATRAAVVRRDDAGRANRSRSVRLDAGRRARPAADSTLTAWAFLPAALLRHSEQSR
jgi:type IV secretory pathway TrbF-like protein